MPLPDRVMMSAGEIAHFNERALLVSGGTRVLEIPELLPGKDVTDKILEVGGSSPRPTPSNGTTGAIGPSMATSTVGS